MEWASAASEHPTLSLAMDDVVREIGSKLGSRPDLVFAFATPNYEHDLGWLPDRLSSAFPGAVVLGCSAQGVIGAGRELETGAALAVVAARLPDVALAPFYVAEGESPLDAVQVEPDVAPAFVLFPDPFSAARDVLQTLDEAFPRSVKVGGITSGGGNRPGEGRLFLERVVHRTGVVGVALYGDLDVDPVIAQGCRPLGRAYAVTRSKENLVLELDGGPVIQALEAAYESWDARDRALFRRSPMVGISVGEPDYLVRHVIGLDRDHGVLALGVRVEDGMQLRFHVRDRSASSEDLDHRLRSVAQKAPPAGALLFTCLARGQAFFGEPDHDAGRLAKHLGPVPVGGFFCNGEIGPVRGTTYVHGYTSAFALFRPRVWD